LTSIIFYVRIGYTTKKEGMIALTVYILLDMIPYEKDKILLITTNRDDLKAYLQKEEKIRSKWRYDDLAVIVIDKEMTTTSVDYQDVYKYTT